MCARCERDESARAETAPRSPFVRALLAPLRLIGWLLILPVRFYQLAISPLLPPLCRYRPTCSAFMIDAIRQKGPLFGLPLGTLRLLRCQPLGSFGFDPVEGWPPYRINGRWRWRITTEERDQIMAEAHARLVTELMDRGDRDGLAMIGMFDSPAPSPPAPAASSTGSTGSASPSAPAESSATTPG